MGGNGWIVTSSDGISWDNASSGTNSFLSQIIYANGIFLLIGEGGITLNSTDGTTWNGPPYQDNSCTNVTSEDLYGLTYGNDKFVATGFSGTIITSTDGMCWDNKTSGTTQNLWGVTYKE